MSSNQVTTSSDSNAPSGSDSNTPAGGPETYQALRTQLDEVLSRLQDPDCDVDQAADLYEQALRLTVRLERYLETAENHIRRVEADFEAGGGA